jgi:hypothetical protein
VLDVWAERRTRGMALLDAIAALMNGVQWLRGGTRAAMRRAGGEIPRVPES